MHELSLCEDLLKLLQERADTDNFNKVINIRLEVGILSCIEPEALQLAFHAVVKNSVAESATLEIEKVNGQGWCDRCAMNTAITQRFDPCPICGYSPLEIRQGDKMRIKYIEVI